MKNLREYKDITDYKSENFLAVNSCGYTRCLTEQTILRSKGRKDFHLIYITKGSYKLLDEEEKSLSAGYVIFYRPNEKQCYSFNSETEACWVHFTGTAAEELSDMLGFEKITQVGVSKRIKEMFDSLINSFGQDNYNLLSISYLLNLCSEIKNCQQNTNIRDSRIEKVKGYMNENYSENHTLEFYAKMCNLSPDRFSHLFKTITGVSPYKYILEIRLRQAKYLLVYSELSISEIAREVGFEDPLYMSRLFSRKEKLSPKAYRKNLN